MTAGFVNLFRDRGVEMGNVILTEFKKLQRSKVLLYVILAGFIPSLVKFLQQVLGDSRDVVRWEWFAAQNREIMVYCVFTALVLASAFVFSLEYKYGTISCIFTSSISRAKIYISKMLSIFALILLLFVISACSDLLLGFIAFGRGMPSDLMLAFLKSTTFYILSYFLLSPIIVMVVILLKRFVLSVVVVMGYLMLVFPFHLKYSPYILPFMIPSFVAAKILGTDNYIFSNGYAGSTLNLLEAVVFLLVLAVISIRIGITRYAKQEAA